MNTLQDLRSALDAHAAEVTDTVTADRVAAVTSRARVVRRRRAVGIAAAAALAVGSAGVLTLLPGGRDLSPTDAPDSMTSLGWRYQVSDTVREDGDKVSAELEPSDLPRLVSWATAGEDQSVVVRLEGAETWASDVVDFGDFVWVPPGFGGRVTVTGEPGLVLATYELDQSVAPEGVGEGIGTLREDVAGHQQVGAGVGEPGQASLEVPVDADRGVLQLAYGCDGLPRGYDVRIGVVGAPGWFSSGDGCTWGSGFDPGGSAGVGMPGRWGPGAALRMWVVRAGVAVDDGDLPDLRLSLGAYALADEPLTLARNDFPRVVEYGGKVFEAVDSVEGSGARLPRLAVPEHGDYLVDSWMIASPATSYRVRINGAVGDTARMSGFRSSGTGVLLVTPGAAEVSMQVSGNYVEDVKRAALVLYRRVE